MTTTRRGTAAEAAGPLPRPSGPRHRGTGETSGPPDPGRRRLLKTMGVAAAAAAVGLSARDPASAVGGRVEELAVEHAPDTAVLVDVTRCIGCGSCAVACKLRGDLPSREDQPWVGPDAAIASSNRTAVRWVDGAAGDPADDASRRNVKRQCLHCLDPTCRSVCPVKAIRKTRSGAVTYDPTRCIGCRYCIMACPFDAMAFDWDGPIGQVQKCDLCVDRTASGGIPACVEACPRQAIVSGPRAAMLAEAHRRIEEEPDLYVPEVYGETETGGTSVMYLSDVPFAALGLPAALPGRPPADFAWQVSRLVPPFGVAVAATLVALHRRRLRLAREAEPVVSESVDLGEGGPR